MCGRYAASAAHAALVEIFEISEIPDSVNPVGLLPRWNIAPTDPVPAVVERRDKDTGQVTRKLLTPRWGLVPSWSKNPQGAARMINARSETVAEKSAFRKAFATRRCLLPADGYYEWYQSTRSDGAGKKGVKQPFFIHPTHGVAGTDQMVMAGIYEFWRSPDADPADPAAWLTTCAVITTQAIDSLGVIHDRMPMQVAADDWSDWLDPHLTDPLAAHDLLHVPAPDAMTAYPVSTAVNKVGTEGPELIKPIAAIPIPDQHSEQKALWEA